MTFFIAFYRAIEMSILMLIYVVSSYV